MTHSSTHNAARTEHALPEPVAEEAEEPPSTRSNTPQGRKMKSEKHRATSGQALGIPRSDEQKQTFATRIRVAFRISLNSRLRALFTPTHELGPPPSYFASLRAVLAYTPLNVLLVFIPVTWALHYTHQNDTVVFVCSALGLISLAALLGFGTEQVALRTSQAVGGLLNATIGNVIELIIAGIALMKCELALVQSALLGGLLSNLLLVLGMAFVIGGLRFSQQEFQPLAAQLNASLLTVAVISFLVPAAFHEFLGDTFPQGVEGPLLLKLSRGSAVVLIMIYVAYLFFQFYSHNHLFHDVSPQTSPRSSRTQSLEQPLVSPMLFNPVTAHQPSPPPILPAPASSASSIEHPKLNMPCALGLLVLVTGLAFLTAEHLVNSINGLVESSSISKEWLAIIVIPIVSNAAEHATAVVVARKGKFDLVLGVAVGSCIQIALFVIPFLVLLGWIAGKPLTLLFDPLETACLFLSVLLVKFSIEDGKTHWMSGFTLVATYTIIAISFWFFPTSSIGRSSSEILVCS